jgi:glycosyltransferase involved in cell wall biosynthesis
MPKFSIITVNLNNKVGLQKTLESVFAQTFTDYEYIIIDGGSTDGSKELIEKHQNKFVYAVSIKDSGIFNAQNKGILKSKGEYLLFLNSGDKLSEPGVINYVNSFLGDTDIVYGDILINSEQSSWVKKYNEPLSFEYFTRDTLPHQASFIKKLLFDEIGFYSENLGISSDWKFFLDAVCKYDVSTQYLDRVITEYDFNGLSSLPDNWPKIVAERKLILDREWKHFQRLETELQSLKKEITSLRHENYLLLNSRVLKAYFKIKNMFLSR